MLWTLDTAGNEKKPDLTFPPSFPNISSGNIQHLKKIIQVEHLKQ